MSVNPLYTKNAKILARLEKESTKAGLKINVKKTKEMRIAKNNRDPFYTQ